MLGDDGYELVTPNVQPARIPQDTDEQYAYMRKKQQSNTINSMAELEVFAKFDADNFDSMFDNMRSMAGEFFYKLPRAALSAIAEHGSVSGHLLDTYRAYVEEMPAGITSVRIEPRQPKPWAKYMKQGMPGFQTFPETRKRMDFKYVRDKLPEQPGPHLPPSARTTTAPDPEPQPVAAQTSLSTAPVNVAQAILNALSADNKIAGYVFYPDSQENEFAYNFIGY